jgi:hypothetical protein
MLTMADSLTSGRHSANGLAAALDYAYEAGWSDGLPIVPPTEAVVRPFLNFMNKKPADIIVDIAERGRTITAEKLAINSAMAGCRPEYLPVIIAALEAMADSRFRFNHLASQGSPWPLIVVNGPIIKQIGLNSGAYVFGPGCRANATIARAVSLVLRNCAGAKYEDVQRGTFGNPIRWAACIAENEETGWTPLHVQRGFAAEESTVTVVSTYPGSPSSVSVNLFGEDPERMLDGVCHAIASWGGGQWIRGTYALLVGPLHVGLFQKANWTKADVLRYIVDNTRSSVADLKYRGAWGNMNSGTDIGSLAIKPGDSDTYLYLFKENPELDKYLFLKSATEDREISVMIIVTGGDSGARVAITVPYQFSTTAVTKAVRSY